MKPSINLLISITLIMLMLGSSYLLKNHRSVLLTYRGDEYEKKFIEQYQSSFSEQDRITYQKEIEEASVLFIKSYEYLINQYIYSYSAQDKDVLLKNLETSLERVLLKNKTISKKLTPIEIMREILSSSFMVDPHTLWIYTPFSQHLANMETIGFRAQFALDSANKCIIVSMVESQNHPLQVGDKILSVNGVRIGASEEDFENLIMQEKINNLVTFKIQRGSEEHEYQLKLEAYAQDILYAKVIDDKYLYIKIYQFVRESDILFLQALKEHDVNSLQGIVIDLRDNTGGALTETMIIANFFLSDRLILSTASYREEIPIINTYKSFKQTLINENIPVVVLINNVSASAAELLAGSLAVNQRATIMGDVSYGKWTLQSWYHMPEDNVFFPITEAMFFIPYNKEHVTFQGIGISPHVLIKSNSLYKFPREADSPNHLTLKETEYITIERDAPLQIEANRCPAEANAFPATQLEDRILGCAKLFLDNGANVQNFTNLFANKIAKEQQVKFSKD